MRRVRWAGIALDDLKGISFYLERRSNLATANRVCRAIYDSIQTLRRFPLSGRPGTEGGTRELVVAEMPAYLVVYRVGRAEVIEVLRIWHGAQERL